MFAPSMAARLADVPITSSRTDAIPAVVTPRAVPLARVLLVSLVVFVANAVLLVLQLVAGRLLAPHIGVSLPTWTAIIGVFLTGISLGNWQGGRLADRSANERILGGLLFAGAGTILLDLAILWLLGDGSSLRWLPYYPRLLVLTLLLCLPPAFVLSLITPVAIKLQLPDVAHAGRVAGLVYALGTLGSLIGNFLTGFVLLAYLTTFAIALGAAGLLIGLGALVFVAPMKTVRIASPAVPMPNHGRADSKARLSLRSACAVVFVASFCSMALEIAASRLLAPHLGVSLYSWTGIIGVVLAGVMAGNWMGGRIADKSPKLETMGSYLFLGGMFGLLTLILLALLTHEWDASGNPMYRSLAAAINWVNDLSLMGKIAAWTAILFLAPMYSLGTISPQATRLAVTDMEHAGRIAGRVYAWSCAGAIAGTFVAGWGGIPLAGSSNGLILAISVTLVLLSFVVGGVWRRPGELFLGTIVIGVAVLGLAMRGHLSGSSRNMKHVMETNYYQIRVYDEQAYDDNKGQWVEDLDSEGRVKRSLALDKLTHSYVKGWIQKDGDREIGFRSDPSYLGYEHEQVQAKFGHWAAGRTENRPNILVIGGGGYTFPRWAKETYPDAAVEVVEIDPGVTEMAHRALGLPRDTKIVTHNIDGRRFVVDQAPKKHYQLIVQDAVNDFSVPYHILTKEYNDAVKRLLTPDGVYLLTVIDQFEEGLLVRSAIRTMRETFPHVELLATRPLWDDNIQGVFVIYGSDRPFDASALDAAAAHHKGEKLETMAMPAKNLEDYLNRRQVPVLTDAFAPVDVLITPLFKSRYNADRDERMRSRQ